MSNRWGDDPADLRALDAWITREPEYRTEGPCPTPGCEGVIDGERELCDDCEAAAHDAADDDTKGDTDTMSANDNSTDHTSATLDVVLTIATAAQPGYRWALEGWAAHLRASRHQNHAASSYAKHAQEFAGYELAALSLTLARCVDHGMGADEARALVNTRCEARAAKGAA